MASFRGRKQGLFWTFLDFFGLLEPRFQQQQPLLEEVSILLRKTLIRVQCIRLGDIEVAGNQSFDIVLANINRNVILGAFEALYLRTKKEGILLVSGILEGDREIVLSAATQAGFQLREIQQRNNWLCIRFTH